MTATTEVNVTLYTRVRMGQYFGHEWRMVLLTPYYAAD